MANEPQDIISLAQQIIKRATKEDAKYEEFRLAQALLGMGEKLFAAEAMMNAKDETIALLQDAETNLKEKLRIAVEYLEIIQKYCPHEYAKEKAGEALSEIHSVRQEQM